MTCETCGAPVELVDQTGGTKDGKFEEKYECANGHMGWVRGEASKPAKQWTRTGSVFK